MNNLINPKLICDGLLEACIESSFAINVEEEVVTIDIKSFVNNELGTLNGNIKDRILEKIKHKKSKMFGTLQNVEGLPIYFNIYDSKKGPLKYLVLCAFGEAQPARYQIFLEGVFIYPSHVGKG